MDYFKRTVIYGWGSIGVSVVRNPPASVGDQETRFNPWVRKILWRREWLPMAVFLPGKSPGQRSLVGYKELDMTEQKGTGTRDQIANIHWIIEKARVPEKHLLLLY